MNKLGGALYFLFGLFTAMVGHTIHGSLGWSIINGILAPLTWCKWLILHEVNLTIIKDTFEFFLK